MCWGRMGGRGQEGVEFVLWMFDLQEEHSERAQLSSLGFFSFKDDSDYLCLQSLFDSLKVGC